MNIKIEQPAEVCPVGEKDCQWLLDLAQLKRDVEELKLQAIIDPLTGLYNYRHFERTLDTEMQRTVRTSHPTSLILIDLDHFKSINDDYGHSAGDEVLRVYSKNILSIFRHHDMVARYGGEEFAVLLPNTDSDGTVRALNKVRRRANETRWQINGMVADVPTFSAGVSLYKPGESAGAFIERADKALYRAKRLGRKVGLRPDWEEVKDSVMLHALRAKFDQHPDLATMLLGTGSCKLVEDSPYDPYWGGRPPGSKNRLGELLMRVRDELFDRNRPMPHDDRVRVALRGHLGGTGP